MPWFKRERAEIVETAQRVARKGQEITGGTGDLAADGVRRMAQGSEHLAETVSDRASQASQRVAQDGQRFTEVSGEKATGSVRRIAEGREWLAEEATSHMGNVATKGRDKVGGIAKDTGDTVGRIA